MAAVDVITNQQNVVERVSSLALVSSTCGLVSSVYTNTKDTHPYIRSVCEAAEQGVRTITSVALCTASPIISKLEPQIAIANILACKGLDKIEKTLPILHQPSEKIVSDAKNAVSGAKDAVAVTVSSVSGAVSGTLAGVVTKTRGAVQGGVERTVSAVNGGVSTVLESRVGRLVSNRVDAALSRSENLVEEYLPLREEELELQAQTVSGFDTQQPSYYVRLGSLSVKLRTRAYARAVDKINSSKRLSLGFISQLSSTVDQIEYRRRGAAGADQRLRNSAGWRSSSPCPGDCQQAEATESRTLALARSLTQQLQTTCLVLVSGLRGLPNQVQQEALSLSLSASEVCSNFRMAATLGDLPDQALVSSKRRLGQMKESLDNIADYLVNNTPLNWLVGPFYSRVAPVPTPTCSPVEISLPRRSHQDVGMAVEMESLNYQY